MVHGEAPMTHRHHLLICQSVEVAGLLVALRTEAVLWSNGTCGMVFAPVLIEDELNRLTAHLRRIECEIEKIEAYERLCGGGEK